MPNQYRSGDKFRDISAIDSRLAELEQEKQQLIALREELQKSKPAPPISDSFSPEQKIAIFRNLFRGRTDIFAHRWQNQQGRSGYSVACDNEWVQGSQCQILPGSTGHSHSIVNERFFIFIINGLVVGVGSNTMKNTMLRKSCKST